MSAVRAKLEEYQRWGVAHVWLVDPYSRKLYSCDAGLTEVPALTVTELGIVMGPADVFE